MPDAQIAASIRELLAARWPGRFDGVRLDDAIMLGEDGLGLDSIELVEYLLACEDELGGPTTESLLSSGPISLGGLAEHFAEA